MRNSPRFCASKCGKTDVRRPRKRKEKALKPSGFKAFPVAGAEGLEVASQPLLRCPKKSSGCRFSSIFSTAAPTPARCIRHRRRSQAPPLAVPETADARFHSRRFDRCANPCSLYPPPAALAGVARHAALARLSGKEKSPEFRLIKALAASQNRF